MKYSDKQFDFTLVPSVLERVDDESIEDLVKEMCRVTYKGVFVSDFYDQMPDGFPRSPKILSKLFSKHGFNLTYEKINYVKIPRKENAELHCFLREMKDNRRVLITGGSGFLGSHLANELSKNGNQVTLFDNEFRGKIERIKNLKVKYVKGDIRNYKDLKKLGNKYDAIYHLAFINGTDFFYNEPQLVLDVGINGILNIIKFTSKIKKLNFF